MSDYVLEPFKWGSPGQGTPSGVVQWSFATANYAGQTYTFDAFLSGQFQTEVRQAFARWETVANVDFVEVADSSTIALRLGFDFIDGPGSVLGEFWASYDPTTGVEQRAEIRFEQNEGWTVSSGQLVTQSGASFYAIALHEIGHTLGLDHYTGGLAIMNPFVSASDLTASDIHGAQAIYGAAGGTPPVATINDHSVQVNEWTQVQNWIGYSDTDGNAAVAYQFWDSGAGASSGYFWTPDNAHQPAGTTIEVAASNLANVWVRGGTTGGTETMWVRAFDGYSWGNWDSFTLTTLPN
jgi:hypothetical protein